MQLMYRLRGLEKLSESRLSFLMGPTFTTSLGTLFFLVQRPRLSAEFRWTPASKRNGIFLLRSSVRLARHSIGGLFGRVRVEIHKGFWMVRLRTRAPSLYFQINIQEGLMYISKNQ